LRQVHQYRLADAAAIHEVFCSLDSKEHLSELQITSRLRDNDNSGGKTWVLEIDGQVRGFASLSPVPALDGVYDLAGGIVPSLRRLGHGSFLLKQMRKEIPHGDGRLITYAVDSMDTPAALFLKRNGFEVEHEELKMVLDEFDLIEPMTTLDGFRLQTYSRDRAVGLFRDLYEASFKDLPWYQPYLSAEEVSADMEDDDSVLFLLSGETAVGFIWIRWPSPELAEFEPIGLVKSFQGHGVGRYLLRRGISTAVDRGADNITLGVWSDNKSGIRLYRDLGFKHVQTKTYLALDLSMR